MLLGCWLPLMLLLGANTEATGGEPATTPRPPATAQVRLEWVRGPGTESCPDRAALQQGVQTRLGYDPFRPGAKRSVHASIERIDSALFAKVELWDGEAMVGEQELTLPTPDCADLVPVLELVISLAIDSSSLGEPEPLPPQDVEMAQTVVPATEAPPAGAEKPHPEGASGPRLAATVGVLGAVDAAPAPSFGFTLGLEADWPHFSLGLEGRADLPASKPVPEVDGSIRTALIFGTLVPCYHEGVFAGCGLVALGIEQGAGEGFENALSGSQFYSALGLRAQADPLSVGLFSLRLHLDFLVPLTRTDIQVLKGTVNAWTTPSVSWALGAEGVFRIP